MNKPATPPNKASQVLFPKLFLPNPFTVDPSQPPRTSLSEDDAEQLYRKLAMDKTAAQTRCCLCLPFWDQVVSELAMQEESIKNLVLEIGAIEYADLPGNLAQVSAYRQGAIRNVYAFGRYERAIQILRDSNFANEDSERAFTITITASILITFFEITHGEIPSAKKQFGTSIDILRDSPSARTELGGPKFPTPGTIPETIYNAHRQAVVQMLFAQIYCKPEGRTGSRSPEYLYSRYDSLPILASFSDHEETRLRLECLACAGLEFLISLNGFSHTGDDVSPAVDWHHFSTTPLQQFPLDVFHEQKGMYGFPPHLYLYSSNLEIV